MPVKYIPYEPITVEGQAVLNNISRIRRLLEYRENDKVFTKIQRGMPYYEVETVEIHGDNPENLIIRSECVSACAYLKEQNIKVDLVYIDPPFASGADYAKKIYIRRNPKLAEKIKAAEQKLEIDELKAFEEKMYGDIWKKEDYLNWMYENLMAIKSVMSDTASIYVHLDWHIGHFVKVLMDEVFGESNFRNEIIWEKLKAAKGQASSFGNVHDMIYYYSNDSDLYIHNKQYVPHSEIRIKMHYNNFDEKVGKYYSIDSFTQTGQGEARDFGEHGVLEPPAGKHWIWSQERIDEGLKNGLIVFTSRGKPRVKRYLEDSNGIAVGDIWTDINPINSQADESEDYSTQKPEALLDRIIKASSNENMLVADFFGGSGVTAKAAHDIGRKFIHVDVGINSIQTTRDRLIEAGAAFKIMEIKDGVSLFRNPAQTMDKLSKLIPGLQKDVEGVGKFWFGAVQDSKFGAVPVYIPNLIDSKEKVLDKPLINKVINQELQNLEIDVNKVIVYYVDVDDYKEIEKFIRDNNPTAIEVELKDLKYLLHDIVVDDIVEYKLEKKDKEYEIEITRFISDRLIQKIHEFNEKRRLQRLKTGKQFIPIEISEEGLELIELISLDCIHKEGIWKSYTELKIDKNGFVTLDSNKTKEFWDGKIRSYKKPLRMKIRNISGDEIIISL
jgi:adenine-specific DNA-methyltransferase